MRAKALNWIREKYDALQQKYQAIKEAISSPADTKTEPDNGVAEGRRKFSDAHDSFSSFFGNLAKSFEENTQLQQFIKLGETFRDKGYYAGQWGVRDEDVAGSAAIKVRITKNLIDEKCQSNQRKLNSQVKILKTIKNNAKRDYGTRNAYYEKLNRAYQYNPKQFSLLLSVIYGSFAVMLVLADIPLALELTKQGFNLQAQSGAAINKLFSYDADEGVLLHFIKVVMVNWEVFVFAIGVAFCTIYIKIFYDDFIGSPLENLIKKASESPKADYEELHLAQNEPDAKLESAAATETLNNKKKVNDRFNRLWWVRFFVKLGVLLVLFSTIVILGYFRYSVVKLQTPTIDPLVIFLTYTSLTLIFPIISGICASLSLSSFQNWNERRKARKENRRARMAALKATDEFRVKKEEKERNSGFIKWLSKDETIDELTEYVIRCYQSGYKFGYVHPEWTWGGDLFTRAEAMRNRNLIEPTIPTNGVGPVKPVPLPQSALN